MQNLYETSALNVLNTYSELYNNPVWLYNLLKHKLIARNHLLAITIVGNVGLPFCLGSGETFHECFL